MSRFWSLRLLIPLGIFMVLTAVLSISIFYSVGQRDDSVMDQMRAYAQSNIAQLARHAERFQGSDPQMLDEEIAQLATDPRLQTVALIDPGGVVLFSNRYEWRNRRAAEVVLAEDLSDLSRVYETRYVLVKERRDQAQLTLMMSYAALADQKQLRGLERGVIYFVYDLAAIRDEALSATLMEHVPELLLVVAGALILVWVLHINVTRPLAQMSIAAQAISRGEFQMLKGRNAPHEIQTLTDSFNRMGRQISNQLTQLADQVEHTQAILDNMVDGIITIDEHGVIDSYNPAAGNIFGYALEEVQGCNIRMLMPPPYHDAHDGYLANYKNTGVPHIIGTGREVEGRRKDGTLFPMELAVSEISREGLPMYVGMVRDISERKRIDRMKSEFVSTVSHELRTPLTSISGALGLVTGGALGELPEQARQMLTIAHRNSQRLTFLINDLLDMEKLVAGKMSFDMRPQPLLPLIEQSLDANRTYGAERGVTLSLESAVADVVVRVDSQRLMQVLSNLLSNAIKYSPEAGSVEIVVAVREHWAVVTVADHGPGIPAEFHGRIFQKFSQADSSDTRQKGGTGLGLAITKELVERMGGRVGFESVEGQGASFRFELPVWSDAVV